MHDITSSGILTTAGDILFTGGREGYFYALDARTGAILWKTRVGADVASGPMSYEVDGKLDETVDMIGAAGGIAIALRVDHTVESEVESRAGQS